MNERTFWTLAFAILAPAVCGFLCGCGGAAVGQSDPVPRAPVTEDQKTVVAGNNDFALDLYTQLSSEDSGNLFFSPYSISTALAMTYEGARGTTADEMARALHFDLPQTELAAAQGALLRDLDDDNYNRPYRLDVANRLFAQDGMQLLAPFEQSMSQNYQAPVELLNFAEQTEEARLRINGWVEEQTQDKIKDLLKPDVLKPQTRLVLVNAIYFKGTWAQQFKEHNTRDGDFFVKPDKPVKAKLMSGDFTADYAELDGLKILSLPYESDEVSLVVILPDGAHARRGPRQHSRDELERLEEEQLKNGEAAVEAPKVIGLAEVEQQLPEKLDEWLAAAKRTEELPVVLPRFKLTGEFDLVPTLKKMGIQAAFLDADFSGISTTPLAISDVVHKAFVDVNEEGTEAAAATAVVLEETAAMLGPEFIANRPFIFLIRDNHTGSILFMGRLIDPS